MRFSRRRLLVDSIPYLLLLACLGGMASCGPVAKLPTKEGWQDVDKIKFIHEDMQQGDLIISINGTRVKNRAHAIRECKRLWKRGVRTFNYGVLRRGDAIDLTKHFRSK